MDGLFNQAFGKTEQSVPKEVVRELNKELPKGYKYVWDNKLEQLIIRPAKSKQPFTYTIEFSTEENNLPANLSDTDLAEYIYRTQKTIKVKHVYAIDKNGNKRDVYEDPITHKNVSDKSEFYISPSPFPPAIGMVFTVEDGENIEVKIKRQPYESMNHILLENESPSGLKIRWILSELKESNDQQRQQEGDSLPSATMTVTATPSKAKSVDDALNGLKILKAFATGNLYIDGHKSEDKQSEGKLDVNDINDKIDFWTTLKKLQEILNVKFDPGADYPVEDARFAYEIDQSLIENKEHVLTAPFEHFHIGEMKFKKEQREAFLAEHPEIKDKSDDGKELSDNDIMLQDYENRLVGKANTSFTFVQDVNCTLLGAKFQLSKATVLSNLVINRIVPQEKGMELYIANGKESTDPWKMISKYTVTEEDATKALDELFGKYCGKKG